MAWPKGVPRGNKFQAIKDERVDEDGETIVFDSKKEARRWDELQLLLKAGAISHLERQVRIPCHVNGKLVCTYIADFRYIDKGKRGSLGQIGMTVVEDCKSAYTAKLPVYRIKKKLVEALYAGTVIEEV